MASTSHLDYGRQLIVEALELEKQDRLGEALACYRSGIQALLNHIQVEPDAERRSKLGRRVEEYMKQAEVIKDKMATETVLQPAGQVPRRHQKSIAIQDGQAGFSYLAVFDAYMRTAKEVTIRDPYLRRPHQIHNLVRFCELCLKRDVRQIKVITGADDGAAGQEQLERLAELKASLSLHSIAFSFSFDPTLHDRDVQFDNGWVVRLGRGLDYFKRVEGTFVLGFHDMDLRPCHAVNIDIWQEVR
eukprot:m.198211 g.198211  ORF g.198211 m.198211 type:complete len:245 (+) comp53783_c0_seq1:383-1117(+)